MIAAALVVLAPMLAVPPAMVDVFGDAGVERFLGNGELTAGFTRFGELGVFRWPTPGSNDHLYYLEPPEGHGRPDQGGMWGVETGGEFRWLLHDTSLQTAWDETPLGIARSRIEDAGRGLTYGVEAFVARDPGVLAIRLDLPSTPERPRVVWYSNFAPCTRRIPGLPVADWLLDGQNDFAVFAADDGNTIVHFRPYAAATEDVDRAARMFEEDRSTGEWSSFGPGIYIACASEQPIASYHCGREASPSSAFTAAATGRLQNTGSAAGACDAAIELIAAPDDGHYFATVYLAAGETIEDALSLVARAKERGYGRLRAQTVREWAALGAADLPEGLPDAVRRRCEGALQIILTCRDARSGAIVRRPSTQPPLSLVWPRFGALISAALDMAGLHAAAEANLDAAIATIREAPDATLAGSMPAATYSDGTPAVPEYIHDVENLGWLLWSCLEHARATPESAAAWLKAVWPRLSLAADYVAAWSDPRDGAPLHSFNWQTMHDDQQERTALVAFLGMDAMVKLASMLEVEIPDAWLRRRNELDLWIQLHHLQQDGEWRVVDEGVFWLTEQARQDAPDAATGVLRAAVRPILDAKDPRWIASADAAMNHPDVDAARWRDAVWMRSGTDAPLRAEELPAPEGPMFDAVDAANYLLAVFGTAGHVPSRGRP